MKSAVILPACLLAISSCAFGQEMPTAPTVQPSTASPQEAAPTYSGMFAVSAAPAAAVLPNALLNGTAVKLRLAENLTSASAKTGQQVSFEVLEEVDVRGVPVIAKGAQALATVTFAESKRSMGRAGRLDVNVDSVRLIDGETVALSATKNEKGGGHTGAMTAGMVGTAIVFFPAAPLLLFIHGKDITIPKGTEVTAFVAGDMKLNMANFGVGDAVPGPGPVVVASLASLTVESSVAGADITVDGNFVGSTPSTVSMPPGQHVITVSKKGYGDWTRSMMVSGSAVRLSAELQAKP